MAVHGILHHLVGVRLLVLWCHSPVIQGHGEQQRVLVRLLHTFVCVQQVCSCTFVRENGFAAHYEVYPSPLWPVTALGFDPMYIAVALGHITRYKTL